MATTNNDNIYKIKKIVIKFCYLRKNYENRGKREPRFSYATNKQLFNKVIIFILESGLKKHRLHNLLKYECISLEIIDRYKSSFRYGHTNQS